MVNNKIFCSDNNPAHSEVTMEVEPKPINPVSVRKGVRSWRIRSLYLREFIAEVIGVFVLVTIGNGSVAQSVLSGGAGGQFLTINLCYGLGVTIAIFMCAGVSGAHLNPAVTIALALFGKFQWKKVPLYIAAQMLGGFLSGVMVYLVYFDALNAFDNGTRVVMGANATAGIFSTYPQDFLSLQGGVLDQVFSTALLVGSIFSLNDKKNNEIVAGLTPLLVGILVVVIGMSFGFNCGYAINPARDLGPRLFTLVGGWGTGVFTKPTAIWWLVPTFVPIVGGVIGAGFYEFLISQHIPSKVGPTNSDKITVISDGVERINQDHVDQNGSNGGSSGNGGNASNVIAEEVV